MEINELIEKLQAMAEKFPHSDVIFSDMDSDQFQRAVDIGTYELSGNKYILVETQVIKRSKLND